MLEILSFKLFDLLSISMMTLPTLNLNFPYLGCSLPVVKQCIGILYLSLYVDDTNLWSPLLATILYTWKEEECDSYYTHSTEMLDWLTIYLDIYHGFMFFRWDRSDGLVLFGVILIRVFRPELWKVKSILILLYDSFVLSVSFFFFSFYSFQEKYRSLRNAYFLFKWIFSLLQFFIYVFALKCIGMESGRGKVIVSLLGFVVILLVVAYCLSRYISNMFETLEKKMHLLSSFQVGVGNFRFVCYPMIQKNMKTFIERLSQFFCFIPSQWGIFDISFWMYLLCLVFCSRFLSSVLILCRISKHSALDEQSVSFVESLFSVCSL